VDADGSRYSQRAGIILWVMAVFRTVHAPAAPEELTKLHRGRAVPYTVAVLAVAVALGVRLALDRFIGEEFQPYATTYVAVAIIAWWAGLGPAIVTTLLGLFSSLWIVVPPRNSFAIRGLPDVVDILIFIFVASSILVLTGLMRKAKANLAKANADLEGLVQERTARLAQTLSDLEHFSHALAHDLRAPLRAMHGYAALLERSLKNTDSPQTLDFSRRIRESAERLDMLVQDSLNYAQILRGEMPLRPIELTGFLGRLIESYPDLEAHAAEIRIESSLPPVLGNEAGLTQCFANLLRNALKFVAPGVAPQVLIRAERLGEWVRIWVCDNGIGISKGDQRRVFEMFQRGHLGYEGTGMGLAIVKKAVQRMGGSVGVESEPDRGSRFWLDLQPALA
jgi:signal transduction histidine kinase